MCEQYVLFNDQQLNDGNIITHIIDPRVQKKSVCRITTAWNSSKRCIAKSLPTLDTAFRPGLLASTILSTPSRALGGAFVLSRWCCLTSRYVSKTYTKRVNRTNRGRNGISGLPAPSCDGERTEERKSLAVMYLPITNHYRTTGHNRRVVDHDLSTL